MLESLVQKLEVTAAIIAGSDWGDGCVSRTCCAILLVVLVAVVVAFGVIVAVLRGRWRHG